jgi:hypothetical protein
MSIPSLALPKALLGEIRALIESARQRATAMVNSELTLLFWHIGRRIYTEVLAGGRAGYGEQIVPALATQLTRDYGHGFAEKSLRRMVQFATTFRWSVRTRRGRIDSMLYERTALSRQPDALITHELATMQDTQPMSPNLVMRDPYILDFLGLRDTWQESDLEAAIIREMGGWEYKATTMPHYKFSSPVPLPRSIAIHFAKNPRIGPRYNCWN